MNTIEAIPAAAASGSGQDELYQHAVRTYGAALERLARAYEADLDLRREPAAGDSCRTVAQLPRI